MTRKLSQKEQMAYSTIARLEAERDTLREEVKTLLHGSVKEEVFDIVCRERDTLRAQLAERDALFARVIGHLNFWSDHPYAECLHGVVDDYRKLSASAEPSAAIPPVDGDLLPPIGSKVLIHLGREGKWVDHTVVGYYAWGNLRPDPSLHRVFVRVRDDQGYLNARLLSDIRPADATA